MSELKLKVTTKSNSDDLVRALREEFSAEVQGGVALPIEVEMREERLIVTWSDDTMFYDDEPGSIVDANDANAVRDAAQAFVADRLQYLGFDITSIERVE